MDPFAVALEHVVLLAAAEVGHVGNDEGEFSGEQLGGFREALGDNGQFDGVIFEFGFLIFDWRERGSEQWGEFVELGLDEICGVGARIDEAP